MRFLESRNFNLTNFNPPSLKCFLHIYDRCLVFNCFENLNCEKKSFVLVGIQVIIIFIRLFQGRLHVNTACVTVSTMVQHIKYKFLFIFCFQNHSMHLQLFKYLWRFLSIMNFSVIQLFFSFRFLLHKCVCSQLTIDCK